jgi:nitroreductase
MFMKKSVLLFFCLVIFVATVAAQERAIDVIVNNFGARTYVAGAIPKADLDRIVQAGVRAPSAGNRQPWRFIVVQDAALAGKIISGVSGALIAVVADGDNKTNTGVALDCALATESVYLAAQALGYGSRIYTGPVDAVNRNLKTELGIGAKENVYTIVRIGKLPSGVDAVSGASSRKNADAVVTYR